MKPEQIKEGQRTTWKLTAPGWMKHDRVISEGARPVSERLLRLVGISEGHRLLDIASGTGEPALTAAEWVGPHGAVIGTDLVEEMLAYAREKASAKNYRNVEFRAVDGEELDVDRESFDAVTCRWGLMFMPNPVACMKRAHEALKPGGRAAVATWAEPQRNPFASVPMGVVMNYVNVPPPPPGTPGIFGIANPNRLQDILSEAGFLDIEVEEMPVTFVEVESGTAYWDIMRELAGPIVALINTLSPDLQAVVHREISEAAQRLHDGQNVKVTGVTLVASGRK
ncbi:methyltransferase domain-containing protein [bacterium]|nr:methyltransferase domain-containing protein [bacterium]